MQIYKLILFVLLISFLGCQEIKDDKTSSATTTSIEKKKKVTTAPLTRFDTEIFIKKYNGYMSFANDFDQDAQKIYLNYISWADPDKGPRLNDEKSFKVGVVSNTEIKFLKEAISEEPIIEELDDLMKEVSTTATQLYASTKEANLYYKAENYKDDGKKGIPILHKKLIKDFRAYFKTYDSMNVAFVKLQKDLSMHEANRLKERGLHIRYNVLMMLYKTEDLVTLIGALNGSALKNLDRKKFEDEVAAFKEINNELVKYESDENQVMLEYGEFGSGRYVASGFVNTGASIIKQCRDLLNRIDTNDYNYDINHKYIHADGSPEKLQSIYIKMVEDFNGNL